MVALNCPRSWARIYISNVNWAGTMLTRALKAPLSIAAEVTDTHHSGKMQVLKLALEDPDRIEVLQLSTDRGSLGKLAEELSRPMRNLRTLVLHLDRPDSYGLSNGYHPPSSIFEVTHPRLQHLTLLNISGLHWSSPLFCPSTTELSIVSHTQTTDDTLSAMFTALKAMPHLQVLDLVDFVPLDATLPLGDTITLPYLRTLRLYGYELSCTSCATIFNHLAIPTLSTVEIFCGPVDSAGAILNCACPMCTEF